MSSLAHIPNAERCGWRRTQGTRRWINQGKSPRSKWINNLSRNDLSEAGVHTFLHNTFSGVFLSFILKYYSLSFFFLLPFYAIKIGRQISLLWHLSQRGRNERSRHLCLRLLCSAEEAHSACLTCCSHAVDLCYAPNLFVIVGVGRAIFLLCVFTV